MRLMLVGMVLVAGCSAAPTAEQIEAADYGPEPDAEAIIRTYLNETLIDPSSLTQFSVTAPAKCGVRAGITGAQAIFGWCADYTANAKNRYGGYTGRQRSSVMIRDGEIIMVDGLFVE